MYYRMGSFGILDMDGIKDPPAVLIDGGVERRAGEEYFFDNRKRPGYGGCLIQYTLEGSGIFEKQGICRKVLPGQGFCVRLPEDSSYYLPKESGDAWIFLYLHFSGEGIRPYVDRLAEEDRGMFHADISSRAVRMFLTLQERLRLGYRMKRYEGSEFVFAFLCALLREVEQGRQQEGDSLALRGIRIMEREYARIESMEQLAERLNVSQEHFCRVFRQEQKMTPGQYLTNLRIQAAMTDLLNTEDTLDEIARRNGFSGANYFGKVFRRQTGKTPGQYRDMK